MLQGHHHTALRAILWSCVGLESLDISDSRHLTLEPYRGPWVCTKLMDLNIQNMALEVTPNEHAAFHHASEFVREKLL